LGGSIELGFVGVPLEVEVVAGGEAGAVENGAVEDGGCIMAANWC
jgi:hypothetical protein